MDAETAEESNGNENGEFTDVSQFLSIYMAEGDASLRLSDSENQDEDSNAGNMSQSNLVKGMVCETTVTPIYPNLSASTILSNGSFVQRPSTLASYLQSVQPLKGDLCIYCHKFISKRKMRAHLRIHTGEKPYECEFCKKCFARSDKLKTHRRMHTGEKPYGCFCGRRFTRIDHMKMHAASHSNIEPSKRDSMLEEIRQKERQVAPSPAKKPAVSTNGLPCPYCPSKFVGKYKLDRHIRTHTGDKPYKCDCGMRFTRLEHLKKHQTSKVCPNYVPQIPQLTQSTNLSEFLLRLTQLQQLQSQASSSANIFTEEHKFADEVKEPDQILNDLKANPLITVIKPEPVPLEESIAAASPKPEAQKPRQTTTKKPYLKSGNLYVCEFCNKMFTKGHKLNIHRRIHTGEKPYSCETCGKGFARKDHMIKHMNVHLKYRKATNNSSKTDGSAPCLSSNISALLNSCEFPLKEEPEESVKYILPNGNALGILENGAQVSNGFLDEKIKCEPLDHEELPKDDNDSSASGNEALNETSILNGSATFHKLRDLILANYIKGSESINPLSRISGTSVEGNRVTNNNAGLNRLREIILANSLTASQPFSDGSGSDNQSAFPCTICGHVFSKLYFLQTHMAKHRGERVPYVCYLCLKEFKVKKNYEAHMLNHEADDETLSDSPALSNARSKRVQCLECSKWLVSQSSLNMHMCSHTGEKPHKCDLCDKYFVRKADMIRHRKSHSEQMSYDCCYCSSSYTRKNKLILHIKKNHPGMEIPNIDEDGEGKCSTPLNTDPLSVNADDCEATGGS